MTVEQVEGPAPKVTRKLTCGAKVVARLAVSARPVETVKRDSGGSGTLVDYRTARGCQLDLPALIAEAERQLRYVLGDASVGRLECEEHPAHPARG
jgi:hypothetical protein